MLYLVCCDQHYVIKRLVTHTEPGLRVRLECGPRTESHSRTPGCWVSDLSDFVSV